MVYINFNFLKLYSLYIKYLNMSRQKIKFLNFSAEIFNMDDVWGRIEIEMYGHKFLWREIANTLKINESTVSMWRKNNTVPRADDMVKIANLLNTSVEYLVTGKDPDSSRFYRDALKSIRDIADRTLL